MLIITIAMATILAYAAHVLAGRLVGMGITTLAADYGVFRDATGVLVARIA